jgi:hypothetical protein
MSSIEQTEIEILSQIYGFVKPIISPFYKENVSKRFDKIKCFHTPTESHNYVTKINYSIRNPERISRGLASDLDRDTADSDDSVYYSYLIDDSGALFGRVYDALEMGTSHQMLVERENDPVFIAGEMKIQGDQLWFNFESGTFSKFLKLDEDPKSKEQLMLLVGQLFSLYRRRDRKFSTITFMDTILFPVELAPSDKELEYICTKYKIPHVYKVDIDGSKRCSQIQGKLKSVVVPENDICINSKNAKNSKDNNARNVKKKLVFREEFSTKKEAETYYKTHPYEFVIIYSKRNRTWYWNENEATPHDFTPAPESAYEKYTD